MRYVAAIDLGQVHDPTALAVLEVTGRGRNCRFDVRHLERHLGEPYTEIAAGVKALTSKLAKLGETSVAFDQTGVGRAVGDIFRGASFGVPLYGVSITSGDSVTRDGCDYRVPKRDLVSTLQIVLQNDRLRIAKALPLSGLVVRELLNFKVKVTAGANEIFEAQRAGEHDDFVLALAIGCWLAEGRMGDMAVLDLYDNKHKAAHDAGFYRSLEVNSTPGPTFGWKRESCGIKDCEFRLRKPEEPATKAEPGPAPPSPAIPTAAPKAEPAKVDRSASVTDPSYWAKG
jgi:hypothetical protein